MSNTEASSLVDQIANATADDLANIDADIAKLESEQGTLQNKIDALRKVRKIIDLSLNGKPPRKPRTTKPSGQHTPPNSASGNGSHISDPGEPSALAKKIQGAIEKFGPQTCATIAMHVGTTPAAVGNCVANSDLFAKLPSGTVKLNRM